MTDQKHLICGTREHPDGSILIPYSLAGPDKSVLCENPARYRVGTASVPRTRCCAVGCTKNARRRHGNAANERLIRLNIPPLKNWTDD